MNAERAWRSGAANDEGATRPSPPLCNTPVSFPGVMTLASLGNLLCDDRKGEAAFEKVQIQSVQALQTVQTMHSGSQSHYSRRLAYKEPVRHPDDVTLCFII